MDRHGKSQGETEAGSGRAVAAAARGDLGEGGVGGVGVASDEGDGDDDCERRVSDWRTDVRSYDLRLAVDCPPMVIPSDRDPVPMIWEVVRS